MLQNRQGHRHLPSANHIDHRLGFARGNSNKSQNGTCFSHFQNLVTGPFPMIHGATRRVIFENPIRQLTLFKGDGLFSLGLTMPFEEPSRRKFSQFMTDHILGDEHRNEFLPVMNR